MTPVLSTAFRAAGHIKDSASRARRQMQKIRAKIVSTIRATGKGVTSTIDRNSPSSEDDVTTSASEPSPKTSNGESTHKSA